MNGFVWLGALLLLLVVLFIIALSRPAKQTVNTPSKIYHKPSDDLQLFYQDLMPLLPEFKLTIKTGVQNRILIYQQQNHLATVILTNKKTSDHQTLLTTRKLGNVLILQVCANYQPSTLKNIVSTIHQYK
jgi:hypothetical protein